VDAITSRFRSARSREAPGARVSKISARRLLVALPMAIAGLVGTLLSFTAFYFVWRLEDRISQKDRAAVTESHVLALQNGLNEYLNKLIALRGFFEASKEVTRAEFNGFAGRLLENEGAIQNFSWVARVTREERAKFESDARADGLPDYRIKAVSPDGTIAISPGQDEYLPIFYSTVRSKSSPLYGIDLRSQPVVRERLERAHDLDQLSAVPRSLLCSISISIISRMSTIRSAIRQVICSCKMSPSA
jgi:CHASE1-domain containing sensor protein